MFTKIVTLLFLFASIGYLLLAYKFEGFGNGFFSNFNMAVACVVWASAKTYIKFKA